jgi:nucleoside-diphosphate-sugar epimerase
MLRVFRAAKLGVAPVFGDGSQELSLVYGPDLGRALAAAGRTDATTGKVYYACHPEVLTSAFLMQTVGRSMGRTVRLIRVPRWAARNALGITGALARLAGRATLLTPDKANEFFAPAWTCDPAPLAAATGWHAEFDLATGAAATVAWYRASGAL